MNAASLARLLLLAAIWGASFLFLRLTVPAFGTVWTVEVRVILAAVSLTLFAWWSGEALQWRLHWRQYLIIGLCNSALPFLLFAYAAQSLGPACSPSSIPPRPSSPSSSAPCGCASPSAP